MVSFSTFRNDWPWNPYAPKNLADKEILSHMIHLEDAKEVWLAPLFQCLPGFAFLGFRIVPVHPLDPSSIRLQAGLGQRNALFGALLDTQELNKPYHDWNLLKVPIPHQLCGIDEDELHLRIEFPSPMWGKVELLAQRIDELPHDDILVDYWYPCKNNPEGCWVHTRRNMFYWLTNSTRQHEYPKAIEVPLVTPLKLIQ